MILIGERVCACEHSVADRILTLPLSMRGMRECSLLCGRLDRSCCPFCGRLVGALLRPVLPLVRTLLGAALHALSCDACPGFLVLWAYRDCTATSCMIRT